jgi:hypothetical protein
MSRKPKCEHICSKYTYINDAAIARHCTSCGERMPLGQGNDVGVEVEIRAAELVARALSGCGMGFRWLDEEHGFNLPNLEGNYSDEWMSGWFARHIFEHDISSEVGPTSFGDPAWAPDGVAAEDALRDPTVDARNAAIIAERTRHDTAWSDVIIASGPRPENLSGATLAAPPRDVIGAIEKRIAERTRHDVDASVVRHAEIECDPQEEP